MDSFDEFAARAAALDEADELSAFKEEFFLPEGTVYMDGNSLGLAPKAAKEALERSFGEWRDLAIGGWLDGNPPWFHLAEEAGRLMAPLWARRPTRSS